MYPVRTAAKAIIIEEGKVLFNKMRDASGIFYILPGGGQEKGEPLHETLRRECHEEIGCAVEPGELLFVRDYISDNHEFKGAGKSTHQLELMFRCRLLEGQTPRQTATPDKWQIGVEWLPLEALPDCVYPSGLREALQDPSKAAIYWGDVN